AILRGFSCFSVGTLWPWMTSSQKRFSNFGIRIVDPIEMIPQKIMPSGRAGGMKNSRSKRIEMGTT
ncbi:MAG: hypothetical protein NTX30_09980, partial [Deltaproteobacteria bacterium]|nr:hypothetical protein [Deltaproteobacteria bacterium]